MINEKLKAPLTLLAIIFVTMTFASYSEALAQQEPVERVLERLATDPTIEEVHHEALRTASLEPRRSRRLVSRVRWSGIFPRVEATLSRGLSRDEDLDRSFQEMDDLSLATDQDIDFQLSVRWDLDRLIYDPDELRAHREVASLAQRRRELLLAVTRMYYELLLLRAQQLLEPSGDTTTRLERSLRLGELRAILDSLTGGLYSRGENSD